jgi:hypothetical protein
LCIKFIAVPPVVLQRGDAGDAGRVDTVEVLQVGADVGEAMLNGFDRPDTGYRGELVAGLGAHGGTRRFGDGDIGAVGELGVDFGLGLVGGVERRGGGDECDRQRDQDDAAGQRGTSA